MHFTFFVALKDVVSWCSESTSCTQYSLFVISSIHFHATLYPFCCLNRVVGGTLRCRTLKLVFTKSNQCNEANCSPSLHPARPTTLLTQSNKAFLSSPALIHMQNNSQTVCLGAALANTHERRYEYVSAHTHTNCRYTQKHKKSQFVY